MPRRQDRSVGWGARSRPSPGGDNGRCKVAASAVLGLFSVFAVADPALSQDSASTELHLELNALSAQGTNCRVTFLTRNLTGLDIEQAVFETVVIDDQGSVAILTLFDFQDLPDGRPRVRQFDLPDLTCGSVGEVLINGIHSCRVDGVENSVCLDALTLTSRDGVELSG